jgi:hypothetical protein
MADRLGIAIAPIFCLTTGVLRSAAGQEYEMLARTFKFTAWYGGLPVVDAPVAVDASLQM